MKGPRASAALLVSVLVFAAAAAGAPSSAWADGEEPGSLAWCELLTLDAVKAAEFYRGLFGWEIERDAPGKYQISHHGKLIAGITEIRNADPEVDESTWLVGVSVDNVRAAVDAARDKGGQVLVDVSTGQRGVPWAVVEDHQGAQLLLLTPANPRETGPESGHWVWTELWTTDPGAAADFYGAVVGWTTKDTDNRDGGYPAFYTGNDARAGLIEISGELVSPGWAPYVGVTDLKATLARATDLGGRILLAPRDDIYDGRAAILADPTGVGFLVYEIEEESR